MRNPNSKANKINIVFSSFLVIGYIICTYFFTLLASQVAGVWGSILQILILTIFGLLLFYATRVGEGKQVKRFSLAVLLLIDLPAFYIILASLVPSLPLHDYIATTNPVTSMIGNTSLSTPSVVLMMACIALGYGIPYTFFAGYEMKEENEVIEAEAETVVEGGIAEELAETEKEAAESAEETAEAAEEAAETTAEEAVDAAEEATEATEEIAEEAAEETAQETAEAAEENTEKEAE